MSKKYVIEIKPEYEDSFKGLMLLGAKDSNLFVDMLAVENLEELNSDYINEHFGEMQDEAYKRGINDGSLDVKQRVEGAYQRGLEDGKKAFDLLDAERDSEYQRGLDDAWEAAKKLFSSMADSDIEKAFPTEWNNGGFNALMNLQPQVAIEKLKAYEEKQKAEDDIKVGDVVEWDETPLIVTRIYQPFNQKEQCDGIDDDGCVYEAVPTEGLTKTGRHFDIADMLKGINWT